MKKNHCFMSKNLKQASGVKYTMPRKYGTRSSTYTVVDPEILKGQGVGKGWGWSDR